MNTSQKMTSLGLLRALSVVAWAEEGKAVEFQVNGENYEGYFISAGDNAPLVLLMHDWDGLTDYEVKRAQMLADMGYSVFAADLFGAGVRPTENKDKKQHTGELYKDRDKMRALMNGALSEAVALGGDANNAVVMGYCFGGAAVLEMARSGADMKGFVTFHGGLSTPDGQDYANAKGNYLILHGSADTAITMDQFASLTNQLEAAGLEHEMVTFSGAPHAFTVFGSKRYREDADRKSWALFSEFLDTTLN
jgi:dienelactone hydrolase